MAATIGKEILGAAGEPLLKYLGSLMLKDVGIVFQDEKNSQNLEKILEELTVVQTKLDGIKTELDKIKVGVEISLLAKPYQDLSTWFDQATRTIRQITQELKKISLNPSDAGAQKELQEARERFKKLGNDIAWNLEPSCNLVDELMMGTSGRKGVIEDLFAQSRETSKGLLQHYIFMKSFCIRYWTAMMKAHTMMLWFSSPNSGVNFRPQSDDHNVSAANALDKIVKQLEDEDTVLQNAIGKVSYHFCTFMINNPEGMWTGASSKGVSFQPAGSADRPENPQDPTKWGGYEYRRLREMTDILFRIGGWEDAARRVLDPCKAEVVCQAYPSFGTHETFGWAIGGQGFQNDMTFSSDKEYTFWIMRRQLNSSATDLCLRFGLDGTIPSAAELARYAVLTEDKGASSWRILAPDAKPDEVRLKFHAPHLPEHDHYVGRNTFPVD